MLEYLKESKDEYAIITLVGKIADLAEKYPFCCMDFTEDQGNQFYSSSSAVWNEQAFQKKCSGYYSFLLGSTS